MTYRDMFVTCQECGKQFVFTVEKQRQMTELGRDPSAPDMCNTCTQKVKYGDKMHGRIKWFSTEKGYGFISQDDGSEIFVHRNSLIPDSDGQIPPMEEGQEVLYKAMDSPKGPQAVQVTPYQG
jgi:CspA family cold shock protein